MLLCRGAIQTLATIAPAEPLKLCDDPPPAIPLARLGLPVGNKLEQRVTSASQVGPWPAWKIVRRKTS